MNHTEAECYRPGGHLHKVNQKEKEKKNKKEEKAHAAEAGKSTSETDSSSHDTTTIFLQPTSKVYANHANPSPKFNDSNYSLIAQAKLLKLVKHEPLTTKSNGYIYHMDSGATSHCSPYCKDFAELTPIKLVFP